MWADDLFAGPGGWDVAARELDITAIGYELDPAACATRAAAGLLTVPGDVRAAFPPAPGTDMLIASPPCPTFSVAGSGSGRRDLAGVLNAIKRRDLLAEFEDPRTSLTLEPLRWILARAETRPYAYVALEQVPPVLPVWQAYAYALGYLGYSVAVGIVYAEQHGVPQTRKRAILVARLLGEARLPVPTHSRYYSRDPARLDQGVLPWVSMAEALGWADDLVVRSNYLKGDTGLRGERLATQPAASVTSKVDRNLVLRSDNRPNSAVRDIDTPAGRTRRGCSRATRCRGSWARPVPGSQYGADTVRVTVEQAAALQSFPAGHPWQGSRTQQFQQIGNAVPPLMARAILAELIA